MKSGPMEEMSPGPKMKKPHPESRKKKPKERMSPGPTRKNKLDEVEDDRASGAEGLGQS